MRAAKENEIRMNEINLNLNSFCRILEMRMPRSSSFSVRDILDLPQMKPSSPLSATTTTAAAEETPTANGPANDGLSDATAGDGIARGGSRDARAPVATSLTTAEANRIQQQQGDLNGKTF